MPCQAIKYQGVTMRTHHRSKLLFFFSGGHYGMHDTPGVKLTRKRCLCISCKAALGCSTSRYRAIAYHFSRHTFGGPHAGPA